MNTDTHDRETATPVHVCRDCAMAHANGIDSVESEGWDADAYRRNISGHILDDATYDEDTDEYGEIDWYWTNTSGCDLCETTAGYSEVADMYLLTI